MTDKQIFLKCAEQSEIPLANQSVTIISDYSKASRFFELLGNKGVLLGMDMLSGTCSGNVAIVPVENHHICFQELDNHHNDIFKFKSMLLICSSINDPSSSPEILFESAEDSSWLTQHKDTGFPWQCDGKGAFLGLELTESGKTLYDRAIVEKYLELEFEHDFEPEHDSELDPGAQLPAFIRVTRNTSSNIIAYVNLQKCDIRHDYSSLFRSHFNGQIDSSKLLSSFEVQYNIIR